MLDRRTVVTFDEMCRRFANEGLTQAQLTNKWRELQPDPSSSSQNRNALENRNASAFRDNRNDSGFRNNRSDLPQGLERGYAEDRKALMLAGGFQGDLAGPVGAENRAAAINTEWGNAPAPRDFSLRAGPGKISIVVKKVITSVSSQSGNTTLGLGNSTYSYNVHPRDCIYDLKTLIYYDVGWAPRHQRLVFNKTELQDEYTLDEHGLKDRDCISLIKLQPHEINPILTGNGIEQVYQPCEPSTCSVS